MVNDNRVHRHLIVSAVQARTLTALCRDQSVLTVVCRLPLSSASPHVAPRAEQQAKPVAVTVRSVLDLDSD